MDILIQIGIGEAYDRLTILEIKLGRIENEAKLRNISKEYDYLVGVMATIVEPKNEGQAIEESVKRLKEINEELWDVEDALREYERDELFNEGFIKLARSVYNLNDERSHIKRYLNVLHNSYFIEEKSYE